MTTTQVGQRVPRIDGTAKATGTARYASDTPVAGLLHARLVLSLYAHARIVTIDISAALELPGVVAVLTAHDLPLREGGAGSRAFEPLARSEVVFAGQPVAMVIAASEAAAEDGVDLVDVTYEPLVPVVDLEDAFDTASPLARVSGELGSSDMSLHTEVGASSETDSNEKLSGNVIGRHVHARGDVNTAFASCAAVVEGRFRTSWIHQSYLEPQVAVAWVEPDGCLVMHASTQGHFYSRGLLARLFGLPLAKIRVVGATLGGAFGGKVGLIEPLVGAAALAIGQPVRLAFTRSEDFAAANPAPSCVIDVRIGADDRGKLRAISARILTDAGAFPEFGGAAIAAAKLGGAYAWPAWRVHSYGVVTNRFGAGAYRAPSATPMAFALESLVDELAARLELDALELRLRNVPAEGDLRLDGTAWPALGLTETLEAIRTHPLWVHRHALPSGEGVGLAVGLFPGGKQGAGASCRLQTDGSFIVSIGAVDMTGTSTAFAAIAAETLGVAVERVEIKTPDTDSAPAALLSAGSMVTYSVGPAVQAAALQVRTQILEIAGREMEVDIRDLEIADGIVRPKGVPTRGVPLAEIAGKTGGPGSQYAPISGNANHLPPVLAPSACAHLAHVRVDADTGVAEILAYVTAQDVGCAINPALCEGQMRGGVAQGAGWAFLEELVHDEAGQLLTGSFINYAIPRIESLPWIETMIVEVPSLHGPFGAKGIGESAVVPGAAALANAVSAATGLRMRQLPMTAPRIWQALQDTAQEQADSTRR